jgi:hypothetical protein
MTIGGNMLSFQKTKQLHPSAKRLAKHLAGELYDQLVDLIDGNDFVTKLNLQQDTDAAANRSGSEIIGVVLPLVIAELQKQCERAEQNRWNGEAPAG